MNSASHVPLDLIVVVPGFMPTTMGQSRALCRKGGYARVYTHYEVVLGASPLVRAILSRQRRVGELAPKLLHRCFAPHVHDRLDVLVLVKVLQEFEDGVAFPRWVLVFVGSEGGGKVGVGVDYGCGGGVRREKEMILCGDIVSALLAHVISLSGARRFIAKA